MENLLNRLERKWGRYSIGNLIYYLLIGQAFAFVCFHFVPNLAFQLGLSPFGVHRANIENGLGWQVVTWLFVPGSFSPFWFVFYLYGFYLIGTALESHWGSFRFQIYFFLGALLTFAFGYAFSLTITNVYLYLSLFLAFATLWPDYTFMIFFIIPVKAKWLAWLDAAFLITAIGLADGWNRLFPAIGIFNYLLFFYPQLLGLLRQFFRESQHKKRFSTFNHKKVQAEAFSRRCVVCGVTNRDDPQLEFRICDCKKCDSPKEYCVKHAWNH